ncbi:hypothetical protein Hdeb2414_s0005g00159301 [Helianthus debilis subsp. tardiflorus]
MFNILTLWQYCTSPDSEAQAHKPKVGPNVLSRAKGHCGHCQHVGFGKQWSRELVKMVSYLNSFTNSLIIYL